MNPPFDSTKSLFVRMGGAWNEFWFTPRDPTLLGLMRILAGLVTLYTIIIHGFTLQAFIGENAWFGLDLRNEMVRDRPVFVGALLSSPQYAAESLPAGPANENQRVWADDYKNRFTVWPPAPHPETQKEAEFAINFRTKNGFDFRYYGLPFPKNNWEQKVLDDYTAKHREAFPPPYPASQEEVDLIAKYRARQEIDPRRLYARGFSIFSVWMHVIDPFWMNVVQAGFVAAALCFVLGLGTRVASVIVWFANLCYIHRDPVMLFGVDTMMTVLLLYLMIGPSGAALSLDRVIARWWGRRKGRPFSSSPSSSFAAAPRVSANIAIRMMQIHLCIIYFISGVSKLQGGTWWNGTAVWNVLGNFEFAPMHMPQYVAALRLMCQNDLFFNVCINGAGVATLAFEIAYPFLIWKPNTRWLCLAGAIFLHGFIGLFMGLKTFSLMMLIFNMAFLRHEEVAWALNLIWPAERKPEMAVTPIRRKPEAVAK